MTLAVGTEKIADDHCHRGFLVHPGSCALASSHVHLHTDAEERRLILQALFRPTVAGLLKDEASPSFMAEWLIKIDGDGVMSKPKLDEIGYWSEVKLDIVREYAAAYSRILAAQAYQGRRRFTHCYIDGFAGAGVHVTKDSRDFKAGSPINALLVEPPFCEYHFIDLDGDKVEGLREHPLVKERSALVHHGDCNDVLLREILPSLTWKSYRRALLVLDPYGINLDWNAVWAAAEIGTVELFLNFMVMDMNRNVFWRNWKGVSPERLARMDRFWGDRSWQGVVYDRQPDLFGGEIVTKRAGNEAIVQAYRERLRKVAGFKFVPEPVPMCNEQGAIVYYLFFAAHKPAAAGIVTGIFDKYRARAAGGA